ncbi:MAG: bifunctional demethylmenaquinone methyltransferase/2-methoxy-6-polyprenyl-1,4-benzoquinol methylase UbiE [Desulfobacteraceae bacterium]|nr:bifunctional demethylmenaquinone methyltransferase/2-methoxy-6-polyprenyl-1,4-benzoquinol methylase UbiE [Desulfobacteraceae bacterium]
MKNVELHFIREMFEKIAPRYDLLNRLLSCRQDVYWRRMMVSEIKVPAGGLLLDVACGTGDVVLEIIRQKGSSIKVCGIDFSTSMLMFAKDKIRDMHDGSNIHLLSGNALNLPFKAETFDALTIAFGIRNIVDKLSALQVFYRTLTTGGMILVLELAFPEKGLLPAFYHFYFRKILPVIGRLFSKNLMAYQYLPCSVENFPDPYSFAATMRKAGFQDVRWKKLALGIAILYVGYKREI